MSGGHSNLLPKGIVVNAPNIEQSIERLAGEPVDGADIERMWKGILVNSLSHTGNLSNTQQSTPLPSEDFSILQRYV